VTCNFESVGFSWIAADLRTWGRVTDESCNSKSHDWHPQRHSGLGTYVMVIPWGRFWRNPGAPSAKLSGHVVTGRDAHDDVAPVIDVDQRDDGDQRTELLLVVVLGRPVPDLAGDAG
jgi:hypothetical protein